MATLNAVFLIGRLGKDAEVRTFQDGGKVANVTLATDESYTDRNGQRHEQTEWHNLVFNGKLAEILQQYTKKGSQIFVSGKIRTRSWGDQQGQKHYQTEISVERLQLLDPKPQQQQAPQPPMQGYPNTPQPAYPQGYPQGQPYVGQGPAPQTYWQGQQQQAPQVPPGAPQMPPMGQPMPPQQPPIAYQLDPNNYPNDLPFDNNGQ